MVRIMNGNGHFACCGSYISPLMVLTSANCIEPYRHNLAGASVEGVAMLDDEDNFAFIETVYTPDQFKETYNFMDLAVVTLRRPIRGKLTEFIKLCEQEPAIDVDMTAIGWGYSSFAIQDPSLNPRKFDVSVQSMEECQTKFTKFNGVKVSDTVFCVTHNKDRRQCVYDPGCPLIYHNELCGIVSVDSSCMDTKIPGVYTNINKMIEFIQFVENVMSHVN
ncbi:hypothetical protein KR093_005340 [Drosophila rubida]|uniref:trypsin n=1 Tax=Drosophila rubida TaxID=30044 RepID=A0AAD4JT76_9MUSC|nr:hypothetical protein KR093_005340 [Drosophila rubida]